MLEKPAVRYKRKIILMVHIPFPGRTRLEALMASMRTRAQTAAAQRLLYLFVALESVIIPIPADPLMAGFVLANRQKWIQITILCLLASVVGGAFGWLLGWGLGETAQSLLHYVSSSAAGKFADVATGFQEYGLLLVFIGAFTPLPYKVIAISAGLFGFGLVPFILISIIGRGLRFFMVSLMVVYYRDLRILAALTTCFGVLVALGYSLIAH